jgi:hypothetical protein
MAEFVSGYRDMAGITSRANSACLRIADIIADVHVPPAVRLAQVAQVMAGEPILTDTCPAAYAVRAELASRAEISSRSARAGTVVITTDNCEVVLDEHGFYVRCTNCPHVSEYTAAKHVARGWALAHDAGQPGDGRAS